MRACVRVCVCVRARTYICVYYIVCVSVPSVRAREHVPVLVDCMCARARACACALHVRACVVHAACVISHRCVISHCWLFTRRRVPICRTARYINFTDVLYLHCCLHVHQEPCAYLPNSEMIYLQMCYILAAVCSSGAVCLFAQQRDDLSTDVLYPCCFLHVQQEPCAYLPNSKIY